MNNANEQTESIQNNSERYIPSAMAQQYYKRAFRKSRCYETSCKQYKWSLVEKVIEILEEKKYDDQFGDLLNKTKSSQPEDMKPDLNGTKLLRMVQEQNKDCSDEEDEPTNPTTYIVISKRSALNPNVREFVPKTSTGVDVTNNTVKNNPDSDVVHLNNCGNGDTDAVTTNDNRKEEIKTTTNEENIKRLKDRIIEASRTDSYEAKRQKNVAIASLLRFCSAKNDAAPKLLTPQYFTNKTKTECHNTHSSPITLQKSDSPTVEPHTSSSSPSLRQGSLTSSGGNNTPSDTKATASSPSIGKTYTISSNASPSSHPTSNASSKVHSDPEVQKSIEKVSQWLDEPRKKTQPASTAPYVGPILFKRKEMKADSPVSNYKENDFTPHGQEWRPTSYATDLAKTYSENITAKEKADVDLISLKTNESSGDNSRGTNTPQLGKCKVKSIPLSMWTNLEAILKERDNAIKKKRESEVSANSDDADVSQ